MSVYLSDSYNPGVNLATEELLLSTCQEHEVIMFLWQNERTIVIGKHQNPYKECDVQKIKTNKVHLVRRKSGGGAVFHDLGNLNFTFIGHKNYYDQDKHFQVILEALREWSIKAEETGRNDITVEGFKISGNAFIHEKNYSCHHGTLLVDADLSELGQYLTPSKLKLQSKGIDSVRSRVKNLCEFNKELTIEGLKQSLIKAFSTVYEGDYRVCEMPHTKVIGQSVDKYNSWEWNFAESPKATYTYEKKFEWGNYVMDLKTKDGLIEACTISTDTLMDEPFEVFQKALMGKAMQMTCIGPIINKVFISDSVIEDIEDLMRGICQV